MFEFHTAGINGRDRAGDFRQLVINILLHSSRFQIAIRGFTPSKCGRQVLRRSFFEITKGEATIFANDLFQ